jgi:hypothetical protein
MPWTYRLERTVPFPRDQVYEWWTDFREDDHRRPGSPAKATRIVLRRQGREVWLRDVAGTPARVAVDARVTLDPPRGYRVRARYPFVDVAYAYAFEAAPGGTRVSLEAVLRPRHLGAVLVPLAAPWWRRYAARDLDYHLRAMAEDLGR